MGIKGIRKQNFAILFAEFEREQRAKQLRPTLRRFAEQYGLNHRHASQIRNGTREIGDPIARRFERNHTPPLPDGWMDVAHGRGSPEDESEEQIIEIVLDLYRDNPAAVYRIINDLIKSSRSK